MTCSISACVASSQAIRSRPSRTASTSRAEWLPGLNPAATNTLVSSTTLPGPVSITAVWRSGGSLRNTHSATAWHSRTRCACAGPRSHRRANAAGPAHAGSAYLLQHAAQPRPQPAVVKCGPRDPDIAPYGVGLPVQAQRLAGVVLSTTAEQVVWWNLLVAVVAGTSGLLLAGVVVA